MFFFRSKGQVLVLCYHRVFTARVDGNDLCITPERFAGQLDLISSRWPVLSVPELADRLAGGKLPRRSVVITFDDGYADFIQAAYPLLEERKLPATLFLSPADLGRQEEFWWDEVERHLLLPGGGKGRLSLGRGDDLRTWELPDRTDRAAGAMAHRKKVYDQVQSLLRFATVEERRRHLEALRAWSGVTAPPRGDYRMLTEEELARLAGDPLITIGSHGLNHVSLAAQEESVIERELSASRRGLEESIGREVPWLAYPYGWYEDWSPAVERLARAGGYRLAFATTNRVATKDSPPFAIPRCLTPNLAGEELLTRLEEWFDAREESHG